MPDTVHVSYNISLNLRRVLGEGSVVTSLQMGKLMHREIR
jgi:hypothetical protein